MIESLRALIDDSTFPGYLARSWQAQILADMDRWMDYGVDGGGPAAGEFVSPRSAMQVSTIWACIQAISGDMAKLPLRTYRRDKDDNRFEAREHYLYPLLTETANPEMSAFRLKRLMQTWALMYGNAYAEVEISGRGQVTEMWPWHPANTEVTRPVKGGPLVYTYTMRDGTRIQKTDANIFHLRGLESDGVLGMNPVEAHRLRIGMSMAQERHGSSFYANGAVPLGVLSSQKELGDKGIANVRKMWESTHGGAGNRNRVAILEEGLTYKETGMKMVDAQYIESMQFGIEELARIYGVPPSRIGHLLRATNNNIEFLGREYVQSCIGQWGSNWQAEIMMSLLSPTERKSVFVEFDYSEYLKADHIGQAEYMRARWNTGSITADEIRKQNNENPLANGMGARPRVPANTVWADEPNPAAGNISADTPEEKPKAKRYLNGHAGSEPALHLGE